MVRLTALLLALIVAAVLAGCGGGGGSSTTQTTAATPPRGELSGQEYALVKAIQATVKSESARGKLCGQVTSKYGPVTALMSAYAGECRAHVTEVTAAHGFSDCIGSIPANGTSDGYDHDALGCNLKYFSALAVDDQRLADSIEGVDAALKTRGISPTGKCGEIFAFGPTLVADLNREIPRLRADVAASKPLLKTHVSNLSFTSGPFGSKNAAVGSAQDATNAAVKLPNAFPASACRSSSS